MKRAQRERAKKAMERAADDMDKWELKKAKSIQKATTIKERAKQWEDVNGESKAKKKSAFAALAEDDGTHGGKQERAWIGDDEMEDAAASEGVVQNEGKAVEAAASAPVEEDELL